MKIQPCCAALPSLMQTCYHDMLLLLPLLLLLLTVCC